MTDETKQQPPSPPEDGKKGKKPAAETQTFKATSPIDHDRKSHAPGAKIELTREAFDQLKTAGVIEGDWKE
jgi:hypothetical protein